MVEKKDIWYMVYGLSMEHSSELKNEQIVELLDVDSTFTLPIKQVNPTLSQNDINMMQTNTNQNVVSLPRMQQMQ